MVAHVEPLNEDGSPVYAFGRRTQSRFPAFSELAHLGSPEDKTFATYISTGQTGPSPTNKPRAKSPAVAMKDLGDLLGEVDDTQDEACMNPGCREVVKNIIGAQTRLGEERMQLNDELADLSHELHEEEMILHSMESANGDLMSSNSSLESTLENLKIRLTKLKQEKNIIDKKKAEMSSRNMILETEKQKLTRRQKDIAKRLSELLWKGKDALSKAEEDLDLGNLNITSVGLDDRISDEQSVTTSYYGLARDDVLDFTDRATTVKARVREYASLRRGEKAPLAGERSREEIHSVYTLTTPFGPSMNSGLLTCGSTMGSLISSHKSEFKSRKLTATTSTMPTLAPIVKEMAHRRPLTPSRSITANAMDGTPCVEAIFQGPKIEKPFQYLRKHTGEPLQSNYPHMVLLAPVSQAAGYNVDVDASSVLTDDSFNHKLVDSKPFRRVPGSGSRSRSSSDVNRSSSPTSSPWRKLDPVFYDERSRRNFSRKTKIGAVVAKRVSEPKAAVATTTMVAASGAGTAAAGSKQTPTSKHTFTRLLTHRHPGVYKEEGHDQDMDGDMDGDNWHISSTFEALGDINKVSLSLANMADLDFQARPKSPLSVASGHSRSNLGSRQSTQSRGAASRGNSRNSKKR